VQHASIRICYRWRYKEPSRKDLLFSSQIAQNGYPLQVSAAASSRKLLASVTFHDDLENASTFEIILLGEEVKRAIPDPNILRVRVVFESDSDLKGNLSTSSVSDLIILWSKLLMTLQLLEFVPTPTTPTTFLLLQPQLYSSPRENLLLKTDYKSLPTAFISPQDGNLEMYQSSPRTRPRDFVISKYVDGHHPPGGRVIIRIFPLKQSFVRLPVEILELIYPIYRMECLPFQVTGSLRADTIRLNFALTAKEWYLATLLHASLGSLVISTRDKVVEEQGFKFWERLYRFVGFSIIKTVVFDKLYGVDQSRILGRLLGQIGVLTHVEFLENCQWLDICSFLISFFKVPGNYDLELVFDGLRSASMRCKLSEEVHECDCDVCMCPIKEDIQVFRSPEDILIKNSKIDAFPSLLLLRNHNNSVTSRMSLINCFSENVRPSQLFYYMKKRTPRLAEIHMRMFPVDVSLETLEIIEDVQWNPRTFNDYLLVSGNLSNLEIDGGIYGTYLLDVINLQRLAELESIQRLELKYCFHSNCNPDVILQEFEKGNFKRLEQISCKVFFGTEGWDKEKETKVRKALQNRTPASDSRICKLEEGGDEEEDYGY
jgi:hypothetical protein